MDTRTLRALCSRCVGPPVLRMFGAGEMGFLDAFFLAMTGLASIRWRVGCLVFAYYVVGRGLVMK